MRFTNLSRPSLRAVLTILISTSVASKAARTPCQGGTITFVAHADDDLLFQSPRISDAIQSGECFTSVIVTTGDAGLGAQYAHQRELGNEAAKAYMAGVPNSWSETQLVLANQTLTLRTLKHDPRVQNIYFRMPDGGVHGKGFRNTDRQALVHLYDGSLKRIRSSSHAASFTLSTLRQAISELLSTWKPDSVLTLDHLSDFHTGDHSDHQTVARIVDSVVTDSGLPEAAFTGFMGYPAGRYPATLSTDDPIFTNKSQAFLKYAAFDREECRTVASCRKRPEWRWLARQYPVSDAIAITNKPASPPKYSSADDLAPEAVAIASSFLPGRPAGAAIDRTWSASTSGGKVAEGAEWVSDNEGEGAWIHLTWDRPIIIDTVILYDRLNRNDQIMFGEIKFEDSVPIPFGKLPIDGSGFPIKVGNLTTRSMRVTAKAVSKTTKNAGLSRIVVLGDPVVPDVKADQAALAKTYHWSVFDWAQDIAAMVIRSW